MKLHKSKLNIFLVVLIAIFSVGCSDDFGDVPECIKDEINEFKKGSCEEGSSVRLYEFQEEEVYVFDFQNCYADGASNVVTNECEILGVLGTEAGIDGVSGVVFFENATLIRVVWEN